jgi:hypothetical protein
MKEELKNRIYEIIFCYMKNSEDLKYLVLDKKDLEDLIDSLTILNP